MRILKTILIVILFASLFTSCMRKDDQNNPARLTNKEWEVRDVTIEMNDKYILDTLLSAKIKKAYSSRVYKFNKDGSFAVASGTTSFTGKWNFGNTDTAKFLHQAGNQTEIIVMRSAKNPIAEVWFPGTDMSIFVENTLGTKDIKINVALLKTPIKGGTVFLDLSIKKQ